MRPEWVEEVWKQVNIIIDIDISTNININNILVTVCSLTTAFPKLDNFFFIVWSQPGVCLFATCRMWTYSITFVKALSFWVPRAFAIVFSSGFLELNAESNRREVRVPPLPGSARA